jgi:hypothetical protein
MVQQLLDIVAGGTGLSVINFLCKCPLKKPLVATEVFGWERRLEADKRNLNTEEGQSCKRVV